MTDLNGLRLEEKHTANKNYEELTFTGHDKSHYRLEFYNSARAKCLEIRYLKENEKNEANRTIKLLKPEFVSSIEEELRNVFK